MNIFIASKSCRLLGVALCVSLVFAVEQLSARGLEAAKKVGSYIVGIQIDRNPPIVGKNRIEIVIKDNTGKIVSDARVLVNYYMPPMPRMAPMNYKTDTKYRNGKYITDMHFIMEGPWVIAIKINLAGRNSTVKFNVDAK